MFFVLFSFQLSPSVHWYCWLGLLTCKNCLPYNLYCVGGDVKHCSINQSIEYRSCKWEENLRQASWNSFSSRLWFFLQLLLLCCTDWSTWGLIWQLLPGLFPPELRHCCRRNLWSACRSPPPLKIYGRRRLISCEFHLCEMRVNKLTVIVGIISTSFDAFCLLIWPLLVSKKLHVAWCHYPNKNIFSDPGNSLFASCNGKLFHSPGPAAANALLPKYVRITMRVWLAVECSRCSRS